MILRVASRTCQRHRRRPNLKLQSLRINGGLGRSDLALRTGVSVESIRMAEWGFTPGPRIQFALAEEFGLLPLDIWPLEQQRTVVAA